MKKSTALNLTFILSLALAAGMSLRIQASHSDFEAMVGQSLKISSGYDIKFLKLVKKLEKVLSTRAKFGYIGDKDPMTGKMRKLVSLKIPKKPPAIPEPSDPLIKPVEKVDSVRLTAIIIGDKENDYTAIIMDGKRSRSVSVGDYIKDRKVTSITEEAVTMSDDSSHYHYDIHGIKFRGPKTDPPSE